MSRMATAEYIGAKRRAYLVASREKRHQILQEVCETVGYEKKYANKLLLGHRKFKERKGRGKTYGAEVAKALQAIWEEVGCPCTTYFKANCAEWIREYAETVATVSPAITDALLRMSASTMDRMLKGVDRRSSAANATTGGRGTTGSSSRRLNASRARRSRPARSSRATSKPTRWPFAEETWPGTSGGSSP